MTRPVIIDTDPGVDYWVRPFPSTEGFSRGKTWPSLGDTDEEMPLAWQGRPLVNVCTAVDGQRAAALVEERLTATLVDISTSK